MDKVTRIRFTQTGVDRYGNPVRSETVTMLPGAALFDPGASAADGEQASVQREVLVSAPKLYWMGAWPDVTAEDEVIVRGRRYAVDGAPLDYRGFDGSGGLQVDLRLVEG